MSTFLCSWEQTAACLHWLLRRGQCGAASVFSENGGGAVWGMGMGHAACVDVSVAVLSLPLDPTHVAFVFPLGVGWDIQSCAT